MEVRIDLDCSVLATFSTCKIRSTHCAKPSGEWQPIVACEREQLSGARGQGADRYHNQQDQNDANETCCPADAFRRVLKNVNERVSGRALERFLYVANTEGVTTTSSVVWLRSGPWLLAYVINRMKVKGRLKKKETTIAFGTIVLAFSTSSAMCATESWPSTTNMLETLF